MPIMKIAFFEIKGWEKEILKRAFKKDKPLFFSEPLSEENLSKIKDFETVSVFIGSKINKSIISRLKKLKLIVTRSTGFDHIEIKECKKRKIAVFNIQSYGENTVAEHTFALILALSRNVHKSYLRNLNHDYSIEGLKGFDLKGKTLGVIGAGSIGKHVIRIARGFEMNVLVYDHHVDEFLAEQLDFSYVPLDKLLEKSDIITLHIPYSKENHHLIGDKTIKKMKKGAILINTSRGGIVDTESLIKALNSKQLSGTGLDVLEGEELIKEEKQLLYDEKNLKSLQQLVEDHILLSKDNVVFTPHIAFYSQEALERIVHETINIIQNFLQNKSDTKGKVC